MAIKINNNTVIDDNKRGIFLKVNPGVYTNQDIEAPLIASDGDIIYNDDDKHLQAWTGTEWKATVLAPIPSSGPLTLVPTSTGVTINGDLTFGSTGGFSGFLKEQGVITSTNLSSNNRIFLNQGMVWKFTQPQTSAPAPNIKYASGDSIKNYTSIGDVINVTLIVPVTGANQFLFSGTQSLKLDTIDIPTFFIGGARPTSSGNSGVDIYNITIIREQETGNVNSDFFALVSQVKTNP